MGKKEQVPTRAIFVQGSLWVWSATLAGVVLSLPIGRLNHTCPSIHTLPVLPGLVPDFSARRAELVAPPCIFDLFRRFT